MERMRKNVEPLKTELGQRKLKSAEMFYPSMVELPCFLIVRLEAKEEDDEGGGSCRGGGGGGGVR